MITQAVILAGGEGTRLRPLTLTTPKPMIPILGKPFVEYMVRVFKEKGATEIIFLVGYLKEQIMDYFGNGSRFGLVMKYGVGKVEDDTGTRLRNAKDLLNENFLLIFGDVYWPYIDLKEMSDAFFASGKSVMMVAHENSEGKGAEGYKNNIMIDEKTGETRFVVPHTDDPKFQWSEVGVTLVNRKAIERIDKNENVNWNKVTLPDVSARNELGVWKTDKLPDTITSPKDVVAFEEKIRWGVQKG